MDRVIIFDTTLRDGEQSPGFSMNTMEKLEMARQLARLNVDVIEAGFPISSEEDFEATREVARQVGTLEGAPSICGLSRVGLGDIDRCWEAVKYASRPRIHTFVATSDIHLKYKLRKSRADPEGVGGGGAPRPLVLRGRGVLSRGRLPDRLRLHVRRAVGGHRGGRA